MSPSDQIAVAAAILGAGIACLALVLAGLSIWGFFNIRESARKAASESAQAEMRKLMDASGGLGAKLEAAIQERITSEADKLFADISMAGAFGNPQTSQPSVPIADKYPKGDTPSEGP